MGVRGLQSFLENNCPDACYSVNIKDLVENYKRETGRQPLLVVDVSSCMTSLYGQLEWIFGGQIKQFAQVLHKFVKSFQSLGVKLILFFDGTTPERKREEWVRRRYNSLTEIYQMYDMLREGRARELKQSNIFQLPPGTNFIARTVFSEYDCCEMYTSLNEADDEIAEYARKHKCFGILGQDTDFVILEGAQFYLSAKHLNIDKLTTKNYNRWALARKLGLDVSQLPVLATLIGNDVISSEDLKDFHRHICKGRINPRHHRIPFSVLFECVSAYVSKQPTGFKIYQVLPSISRFVFRNENWTERLEASIKSYWSSPEQGEDPSPNSPWEEVLALAKLRHVSGQLPCYLYDVLLGNSFDMNTSLEDFRNKNMQPIAIVLKQLRQNTYGILLKEKPLNGATQHAVKEYCMSGLKTLDQPAMVTVNLPTAPHPGIKYLWQDKSAEAEDVKWRLFCEAVSEHVPVDQIKQLPPALVVPTLVLFYLHKVVNPAYVKKFEVEAFLAHSVALQTLEPDDIAKLECKDIDTRAIQLSAGFVRTITQINFLQAACGFELSKYSCPIYFFDGKLFHILYNQVKNRVPASTLCGQQDSQVEQFSTIQRILFS